MAFILEKNGRKEAKEMQEYEVADIDIEEVLLKDKKGNYIPVDLRGQYLEQTRGWKSGDRISASLGRARSRYTPDMVWIFSGDVEVL